MCCNKQQGTCQTIEIYSLFDQINTQTWSWSLPWFNLNPKLKELQIQVHNFLLPLLHWYTVFMLSYDTLSLLKICKVALKLRKDYSCNEITNNIINISSAEQVCMRISRKYKVHLKLQRMSCVYWVINLSIEQIKILIWWWSENLIRVIHNHYVGSMDVCVKSHDNPFSSC